MSMSAVSPFQFHYGTIKSKFRPSGERFCELFQFHYGTIKSVSSGVLLLVWLISIPLWYD